MTSMQVPFNWISIICLFATITRAAKIKYREAFPPEHEGYLPDNFKQRLREIAQNDYLTGEARIDLVDKVYDKLPKTVLMKLPLDSPIYQLPPTTQKKFRALMVDRSLGWRRRAQLYDQLVESLPKKYQKLVAQFAKAGGGQSSSSSSSSSAGDSGANDPEMEAAGMGGAEMEQGGPGGTGGGMSGGMDGGGGMSGGAGGGGYSNGDGYGGQGQEMIYDNDRSGIDYDKYISESSEEKGSKGKPWSSKTQINKKVRIG